MNVRFCDEIFFMYEKYVSYTHTHRHTHTHYMLLHPQKCAFTLCVLEPDWNELDVDPSYRIM